MILLAMAYRERVLQLYTPKKYVLQIHQMQLAVILGHG